MSQVRAYKSDDFGTVQTWLAKRKLTAPSPELLSEIGFITNECVGFLYLTNSGMAILDSYVSDPEASKAARAEAFTEITKRLISAAEAHGVIMLKADTQFKSILALCQQFEFQETGHYTSFQKRLTWAH